jgi:uncharacterized protein HemX
MGWVLLFLVLVAAAFGVLGAVIKATVFIVLTIISVTLILGMVVYLLLKQQARRVQRELEDRFRPHTDRY